jgi:hypothetical protein
MSAMSTIPQLTSQLLAASQQQQQQQLQSQPSLTAQNLMLNQMNQLTNTLAANTKTQQNASVAYQAQKLPVIQSQIQNQYANYAATQPLQNVLTLLMNQQQQQQQQPSQTIYQSYPPQRFSK